MTNITQIHGEQTAPDDSEALPGSVEGELRDLQDIFTTLHTWAGIAGDSGDRRVLHALEFTAEVFAIRGVEILNSARRRLHYEEWPPLQSRNTPFGDSSD